MLWAWSSASWRTTRGSGTARPISFAPRKFVSHWTSPGRRFKRRKVMSSFLRNSAALAALAVLMLTNCSSAPRSRPVYEPPQPVFIPPVQTPQCFDESYYIGVYRTAREFEIAFFQRKEPPDGTKAIDLFLSYLECAPSGSYAMSAHLRKAR